MRVVVSNNSRYSLSRNLVAEVVINNEAFYIDASVFKSTKNYYVGDITFGGKAFTNVYKVDGSKGGSLYLNQQKIAHIRSGNSTWTNMAD